MEIELINIVKRYGNHLILNNFNLSVEKGEMIAIVGNSGRGKSTLLNIIGLLEEPNSGDIFIQETNVSRINNRKRTLLLRNTIGYLFQNYALIDNETVDKNLDIALQFINKNKKQKQILKKEILARVGLEDKLKNKIFELSGGQQQRVSIARLMLKSSDIILADEPTGSLDLDNRNHVIKLLKSLNYEGKTIIIVTHDSEVANSCNRIIKL